MKLYAVTTEQFQAALRVHEPDRPPAGAVLSREISRMSLSMLVDQAELNDHGVIFK
ncbi:MAG: hypothetical protein ABIO99_07310 [Candidatus Limnocylindria bacterium]